MISLPKSSSTLGCSLRTGAAAVMLAGLFAGVAAAPASAAWHHGGPGWHGGWHGGGWYHAGWGRGWYGRPWGYPGYYGYGYVAPPVVYAAPVPGFTITIP